MEATVSQAFITYSEIRLRLAYLTWMIAQFADLVARVFTRLAVELAKPFDQLPWETI